MNPNSDNFSEYFIKTLAECVAKSIVEEAIRNIHSGGDADESCGICQGLDE